MELIDVSRLIGPNAVMAPGRPAPATSLVWDIGPDSPSRVTQLENWTTHLLTHVDVPRHFLVDGETVDRIEVSRFQGPATVVRVAGRAVRPEDVPLVPPGHNLLFATAGDPFDPEQGGYLHPDAVPVLLDRQPNLVGIDAGGVDRPGDTSCPAHHALLGASVLLLEGLDLRTVEPGEYHLWALPSSSPTATAHPSVPSSPGPDALGPTERRELPISTAGGIRPLMTPTRLQRV